MGDPTTFHSTVPIEQRGGGLHSHPNTPKTERSHRRAGIADADAPHAHGGVGPHAHGEPTAPAPLPDGQRRVRFNFDRGGEEPVYEGVRVIGESWNGWPVIRVDRDTLLRIAGYAAMALAHESAPSDYDPDRQNGIDVVGDEDFNTVEVGLHFMEQVFDLAFIDPEEDGLYPLDGMTPVERP